MAVGSGQTGLFPQPPVRWVESTVLSEHSQWNSKSLFLVLSFFQENINPLSWSLVHSASLDQCEQGISWEPSLGCEDQLSPITHPCQWHLTVWWKALGLCVSTFRFFQKATVGCSATCGHISQENALDFKLRGLFFNFSRSKLPQVKVMGAWG